GEIRDKYVAYLARLFEIAERPDAVASARAVLALETRLAEGHWERAETRDVQKTYNLTTREELEALAPAFDWGRWIAALSGGTAGSDDRIAETCVRQPSYLEHLSTVIAEVPLD